MRFCSVTLGCKVNQFETQAIENILQERGHALVEAGQGCDVCIINTCAVTADSVSKSRRAVRRLKKTEPDAIIAVCGCVAQLEPEKIAQLGADLIGGSGERQAFADEIERLESHRQEKKVFLVDDPMHRTLFEQLPPGSISRRVRANLKIQDGCNNFCTYCIVPYTRGQPRSLPVEAAEEGARQLAQKGFLEIVITGIEIFSYGKDLLHSPTLIDVLKKIGTAAPNVRIRLGSLDPSALSEEVCKAMSSIPNLCGHFHISLQSGCDDTLARMGRNYRASDVYDAVRRLRAYFPDSGITADLITGFPGESETEFIETVKFIKSAAFSDMHIFPFSRRKGTKAADMPGQLAKGVKAERARAAKAAAGETARQFRLSQIGKTVEVLFERRKNGFWHGYSSNYIEVAVNGDLSKNELESVVLISLEDGVSYGRIASQL